MTRSRPLFVSTLAASVFLLAACQDITQPTLETPGPSATVTPAATGPFAYVLNNADASVSVIEITTNTVLATIPLGFTRPFDLAITPDGAFAYIAQAKSNLAVIETATNSVVATVPVPQAVSVAITPDGAFAYVLGIDVSVIETATNTVVATVPVGIRDGGVAITPDGVFAYVVGFGSGLGLAKVIDTSTNTVVATVPTGPRPPSGVAITPDGAFAYVTNQFTNSLAVIETATNTVVATVPTGAVPRRVAITPSGAFAYVTNQFSSSVSVIETATNTVVATVLTGAGNRPLGVAITPDGAFAYVANGDPFPFNRPGTVSVIETATNTVVATVGVGLNPIGVAITPLPASPREGCGPRFWRTHLRRWQWAGFHPGHDFDATFGTDFFDEEVTLRRVIRRRGRVGVEFIARVGTAALLNAGHPEVDYPLSVAEVIAAVQTRERAEAVRLAGFNEVGCPFSSR